jgi:hypothetical protein
MVGQVTDSLLHIPGVGPSIARDLRRVGIQEVAELRGRNPESLYADLCRQVGRPVDRCVLYVFRCAVYFASEAKHDPELLKWWNWKQTSQEACPTGRLAAKSGKSRRRIRR